MRRHSPLHHHASRSRECHLIFPSIVILPMSSYIPPSYRPAGRDRPLTARLGAVNVLPRKCRGRGKAAFLISPHRFGTAPFLPMSRARYSDRGGLRKGIDDFGPKKAAKIRPRFAHTSGCPDQLQQPRGHAIACPRGISSGIPTPLVGPS